MTREEAKELLPIIQAFAEGKTLQYYSEENGWIDWINFVNFNEPSSKYRIKPEPKYRPFKNQEECLNEMLKHHPFGWFRSTCNENLFNTICIDNDGIKVTNNLMKSMNSYSNAFSSIKFVDVSSIKFIDGSPFGIKE